MMWFTWSTPVRQIKCDTLSQNDGLHFVGRKYGFNFWKSTSTNFFWPHDDRSSILIVIKISGKMFAGEINIFCYPFTKLWPPLVFAGYTGFGFWKLQWFQSIILNYSVKHIFYRNRSPSRSSVLWISNSSFVIWEYISKINDI